LLGVCGNAALVDLSPQVVLLPNVGHFAMLQAPDEYSQSVLDFINAT
jgi:pimeloyl-ACP methyl ester carboxylesterase